MKRTSNSSTSVVTCERSMLAPSEGEIYWGTKVWNIDINFVVIKNK